MWPRIKTDPLGARRRLANSMDYHYDREHNIYARDLENPTANGLYELIPEGRRWGARLYRVEGSFTTDSNWPMYETWNWCFTRIVPKRAKWRNIGLHWRAWETPTKPENPVEFVLLVATLAFSAVAVLQ